MLSLNPHAQSRTCHCKMFIWPGRSGKDDQQTEKQARRLFSYRVLCAVILCTKRDINIFNRVFAPHETLGSLPAGNTEPRTPVLKRKSGNPWIFRKRVGWHFFEVGRCPDRNVRALGIGDCVLCWSNTPFKIDMQGMCWCRTPCSVSVASLECGRHRGTVSETYTLRECTFVVSQ